jgi:hypothetical protein
MTRSDFASSMTAWASSKCRPLALWGAQTQRAVQNFPPSGLTMPRAFIRALGLIKHAAAAANAEFGDLPIADCGRDSGGGARGGGAAATTINFRWMCFRPDPAPAAI